MPYTDDAPPELGRLEEHYDLIRELGRGGMAAVYLARDRANGRLVAVKAIRARFAEDNETISRFAREARTVAGLSHPNIVRTYAIRQYSEKTLAIVMQYVAGGTLREALRREGAFSFDRAKSVLRDVAEALRYAHKRGLVHRDVKPENIFLDKETGRALLSDFGIARSTHGDAQLTLPNTLVGTPAYMSPEQIDGKPLDGRSDIYSLGVVGWEMLAGERPWAGESLYGVIYKQKHQELPRLLELRPGIPTPLLFAIEGALLKHRDTRWANSDEFLAQLTEDTATAESTPLTLADASDALTLRYRKPDDKRALTATPPLRRAQFRRVSSVVLSVAVAAGVALLIVGSDAGPRRNTDVVEHRDSSMTSISGGSLATRPDTVRSTTADTTRAARTDSGVAARREPWPRRANVSRTTLRTHADSLRLCRSPAAGSQRACLFAMITDSDTELNRAYRAVIVQLRRQAGVPTGAADPEAVQRLRAEQRAWLVQRDIECRRRGRGREGALWAPARAGCMREFSALRAAELDAELQRLQRDQSGVPRL